MCQNNMLRDRLNVASTEVNKMYTVSGTKKVGFAEIPNTVLTEYGQSKLDGASVNKFPGGMQVAREKAAAEEAAKAAEVASNAKPFTYVPAEVGSNEPTVGYAAKHLPPMQGGSDIKRRKVRGLSSSLGINV